MPLRKDTVLGDTNIDEETPRPIGTRSMRIRVTTATSSAAPKPVPDPMKATTPPPGKHTPTKAKPYSKKDAVVARATKKARVADKRDETTAKAQRFLAATMEPTVPNITVLAQKYLPFMFDLLCDGFTERDLRIYHKLLPKVKIRKLQVILEEQWKDESDERRHTTHLNWSHGVIDDIRLMFVSMH